jgi:hypothetical protein
MAGMMPRRMAAMAVLLFVSAAPAAAQDPPPVPMCLPQREGMVACFADKLCLCRFDSGGTLSGRPSPGYRWDCGALRPRCGVVPPDTGSVGIAPQPLLPPSVLVQPTLPPPGPPPGPRPR